MDHYVAVTTLPVSDKEAFEYHERRGALDRLIPPWAKVEIESSDHSLLEGSIVVLKAKIGPKTIRWIARHTAYSPPTFFKDVQTRGPFKAWEHQHLFKASGEEACSLKDEVAYQIPLGTIGKLIAGRFVRKELESMFSYRHRVTRDDLHQAVRYAASPMKIAVSGSSGLVGSRLVSFLSLLGHEVIRLERSIDRVDDPSTTIAPWSGEEECERLEGVDAVVHLAGKSIASGRWTKKNQEQIRSSRVDLTNLLARALARLKQPPKVLVCASAVGIYGERGDEELTEASTCGDDFLSLVATEWEAACRPATDAGIRVANARLGLVLDPRGGALQKMLFPAKACGGHLGNGKQWWSWVALDDVVGSIYHAICTRTVEGPFNVVAPTPLTNREFAKTLGRVVSRPALFPAPAFLLRLAMGKMADGLLLRSARALPAVLHSSDYQFRFPEAEEALRYCLGINRLESVE